jgi:hypothetical protein
MTPRPDSCPDRLSELATLTQGPAGIPTGIPTKCRDSAWRPSCRGDLVRDFIVYEDDGGGRVAEKTIGCGVAA